MTDDRNADGEVHGGEPIFDMKKWRDKTRAKVDTGKRGRKARHKGLTDSAKRDGRSLRATGRDQHLNFKATLAIKEALHSRVGKGKISRWLEEAIIAKFREEGIEIETNA